MGAGYMDYLIADRTVIPRAHQPLYAEKIVYLPDIFIPFDSSYAISDKRFSREELDPPSKGFLFCCFNSIYKITPDVFDSWMRILMRVRAARYGFHMPMPRPQGIFAGSGSTRRRPERLIFAARWASLPEHLARLRAADLFLDTLPYNAHATALDALWATLPVLTCEGQGFAVASPPACCALSTFQS